MLANPIARLRAIGLIEGVSAVILFAVAMPLKYAAGMPLAVLIAGSVHGGLFLLYLLALILAMRARHWPMKRGAVLFVASVVPGGTFFTERGLKREEAALGTADGADKK